MAYPKGTNPGHIIYKKKWPEPLVLGVPCPRSLEMSTGAQEEGSLTGGTDNELHAVEAQDVLQSCATFIQNFQTYEEQVRLFPSCMNRCLTLIAGPKKSEVLGAAKRRRRKAEQRTEH